MTLANIGLRTFRGGEDIRSTAKMKMRDTPALAELARSDWSTSNCSAGAIHPIQRVESKIIEDVVSDTILPTSVSIERR